MGGKERERENTERNDSISGIITENLSSSIQEMLVQGQVKVNVFYKKEKKVITIFVFMKEKLLYEGR